MHTRSLLLFLALVCSLALSSRTPFSPATNTLRLRGYTYNAVNEAGQIGGIFIETNQRSQDEDSEEVSLADEDSDEAQNSDDEETSEGSVHVETYINVNINGYQQTGGSIAHYSAVEEIAQIDSPEVKDNVGVGIGVGVARVGSTMAI
jgi:hypothetical protein